MAYSVDKIRNICLLGHGGDGKTSLAESLLFLTGGTDRLGKVSDGTTVCDYDSEEIKRQITISASLAPVEFEGNIINIIDTPGFFDFAGEVAQAPARCRLRRDCRFRQRRLRRRYRKSVEGNRQTQAAPLLLHLKNRRGKRRL